MPARDRPQSGPILAAAVATLFLTACESPQAAEPKAASPSPAAPVQSAVAFADRPDLAPDTQALPRLVGDSPAIVRINADLDRMDAEALQNAQACTADAPEDFSGGWTQWITRPMTGPDFVTLRIHTDAYCGGAHPSTDQTAVTYDLSTGRRVDWAALIPGLSLAADSVDDMPAAYTPSVRSARLGAWYSRKMLANTDKAWVEECSSVFEPKAMAEQGFKIWADAEGGGVAVSADLPHVVQACADTAVLTADDLRGFDADARLIQAVAAARTAHNWDAGKQEDTAQ